jgi:cell division transport system permease protein
MYAVREAFSAIRRTPLLAGLSAAMVALALFVVGVFGLVSYNLQQALGRVEERVEVVAYIRDGASSEDVRAAEDALLQLEEVRAVRHVSKEEALEAAREDIPEFRDLLSDLEANPLPASLEIELQPGFRTPEAVARVAEHASANGVFEGVAYGQDWVGRLDLLRNVGAVATTILGIGFAVVAALIIATAVRIAIFARGEEIRIMRLVGATNGFIRRPFLLEGFVTGTVGALAALALTWSTHFGAYRLIFPLEWIPWSWSAGGVLAGGVFGLLASAIAIRRYLREV